MDRNAKWDAVVANYFKLSRALQRSKFTEFEILQKCRDLKAQLVEKALQMQIAQAVKIDDDFTIEVLRSEMAKAAARADLALAREAAAKTLVADLQQEVENLKTAVLQGQRADAAPLREAADGTAHRSQPRSILRPALLAAEPVLSNPPSSFAQWKSAKNLPYGHR
jgi:uncharacterized membrane protein YccC